MVTFPTLASARISQVWGNVNWKLYPNGRHMGLDIAVPVGSPVYACYPGVVERVKLVNEHGYGRHVIINHGDFRSLYAHLHEVNVEEGQYTESGKFIGETGGDPKDNDPIDGASGGAHLHWEILVNQRPSYDYIETPIGITVDPVAYMTKLLPPAKYTGTCRNRMNVRSSPGTNDLENIVLRGTLAKQVIEVYRVEIVNGATWAILRSIRPEWVCAKMGSTTYLDLKTIESPEIELGRIDKIEKELSNLTEWAVKQGYEKH